MRKKPLELNENAQERFLSAICRKKTLVWIYLVDGTRLEGYIKSFDACSIYLDEPIERVVDKSAVCAVIPVHEDKSDGDNVQGDTSD
jgi:host factor-I protein